MRKVKISATIISYNEERKIEDCIRSLLDVADEIVVVDSFSTDHTQKICGRYGVRFESRLFTNYVDQKNYAAEIATYDHILSLDADERLSGELQKEILAVKESWGAVDGYVFRRYNNYCGKWMHFSGWYPEFKIRLWDRRRGKWEGNEIHETVSIQSRKVKKLRGHLLHFPYLTVDEHFVQINRFSEMAARAKYRKGERMSFMINVVFSPLFRFVKSYIFQLGFLDGYYGFIFCAASASMTFFKYVRLFEYRRKGLPGDANSSALTGGKFSG